ncbi:MAG: Scaffold-type E3 ligase [Trizodia sp. TS-e1964]|nr:MAG: Scaffold-type E3 ligase [Trizodia sp. TS-e1964]
MHSVNDPPDTIGVSGSMAYIQDLKLSLEEVTVLAVLEMLQAPTIGEFARAPFVEGWKSTPASADSITKQQGEVQKLRSKLGSDNELFKRVYKYTFIVARNPGQKSVALESAIDYWRLLFSQPHGRAWRSKNAPWLDLWITFLQEKWQKSVNRDMWNMTYQFYEKSMEDESMAWWTLNAAWPGVIDDFVGYVKEHRGNEGDKMEIDS